MSSRRSSNPLCFQDEFEAWRQKQQQQHRADDDEDPAHQHDISELFFQLANETNIRYRLGKGKEIIIRQDLSATEHTGGIVWETSYLLLGYLLNTCKKKRELGRLIEVGSGCGLLGLALHKSKRTVSTTLTETKAVMDNLRYNVEQNNGDKDNGNNKLSAVPLDWTSYKEDCQEAKISSHSIDTIVGTDVVFHVRFVAPLLQTLKFLSHEETKIFLCLQERCADAHALLLSSAKDFDLKITDITEQVITTPNCEWGQELDCRILQLRVSTTSDGRKPRKQGGSNESSLSNKRQKVSTKS